MLLETHSEYSPWIIVRADNKKISRLNIIMDILSRVECPDKSEHIKPPDSDVVFKFDHHFLETGKLAP